jgi:hypothetical protein
LRTNEKSPLDAGSLSFRDSDRPALPYCAYWLAASAGAAAGADAPFFAFCFFGFLTCFTVGGEYELTELEPPGAAGWASAAVAPKASETAVNNSVSFFIRFSPLTIAISKPTRFGRVWRGQAASVYKAENYVAANIQSFKADIVGFPPRPKAYSKGAKARSASVFDSDMRFA